MSPKPNSSSMQRWTNATDDPNSETAIRMRVATVKAAQREVIRHKINYFVDLVRGKRVLDVGIVEHFADASQAANWLHRHIAKAAAHCLGVDILPEAIEELQKQGFNVRVCDITKE